MAPQNGLPADPIKKLTAQVSYDAGHHLAAGDGKPGRGREGLAADLRTADLGQTDGFASLRITAHASSGNASVSQTIIHAYPLTPLG